jgi:hypothetical protein
MRVKVFGTHKSGAPLVANAHCNVRILAANRFRRRGGVPHAARPPVNPQSQLEELHSDEQNGGDASGDEPISP